MAVFRIHLKPSSESTYEELVEFCKAEGIIGVGWGYITCRTDDYWALHEECHGNRAAFRALNAVRKIHPGDFIWTREGGNISKYYLCKADDRRWIDRVVTEKHDHYDVGNYVGCKWIDIGSEDKVPGRVINSFRASGCAQHVDDVDGITSVIWNKYCDPEDRVPEEQITKDDLWQMLNPEDLECIVLLYMQSKGYYVYSSMIKADTKTYEGILIYRDGSHRCFPQIKQNERLVPDEYIKGIGEKDRVVLFSSSEDYGDSHPQATCLSRSEIYNFMLENYSILPGNIRSWIDIISDKYDADPCCRR